MWTKKVVAVQDLLSDYYLTLLTGSIASFLLVTMMLKEEAPSSDSLIVKTKFCNLNYRVMASKM